MRRYAPFLALAAVQLLFIALAPTSGDGADTGFATGFGLPTDGSAAAPVASESGPSQTVTSGPSGPASSPGAAPAAGASGATGSQSGGSAAAPAGAAAPAAAGPAGPGQPVDFLGRPTDGDRSGCAPGGLIQDDVTWNPPPCRPAFEGTNPGATYQGVTEDSVKIVVIMPSYGEAVDGALATNGLAETPEQAQEDAEAYAAFFNKRYEFYGRQLDVIVEYWQTGDATEQRAQAKALHEKYKPFMVGWAHIGGTPEAFSDQLARLGIMAFGAPSVGDDWYKQRAPFVWDTNTQGFRVADMVADYYCKKLWGKNATEAGDPAMRLQRRKLGIITSETPHYLAVANRIKDQVEGGMCGSPADGTTLYVRSSDPATAQNQEPALVQRQKDDGITTRVAASSGVPGTAADDNEGYFPENILSGVASADIDTVGRLYQALTSPQQMQNTFGVGFQAAAHPTEEHEFYRVSQIENPGSDPPFISWGIYIVTNFAAHVVQAAGPTLTPATAEQGLRTLPQLAGYTNPQPWDGWVCCNPYAPEWNFTQDNSYTAWADAREVYWSSTEPSKEDGNPGSWVCVDECKRYKVGGWPVGEPKQPA